LSAFDVSEDVLTSAMIFAPDDDAVSRNDEKSCELMGKRTDPTTFPPLRITLAAVSRSRECPKAVSVVRKNHLSPPLDTTSWPIRLPIA
jgi:hypothetical protein